MYKQYLIIFAIVAALIIMDIITGILKAVEAKNLNSSKMREGLFHKGAFIGVIILAWIVEYGSGYLQLGFQLPIVTPVCVYIAGTEIVSVFENLCAINPELAGGKLATIFDNGKDHKNETQS